MFASFLATPEATPERHDSTGPTSNNPRRPKRQQVARACVYCRTYRIKCDAGLPCRNCKAQGRKCSADQGKDEVRTFPLAIKEIDRLKERVKELEEKLRTCQTEPQVDMPEDDNPSKVTQSLPANLDPLNQHGGNRKYYNWDVVSTRTASSNEQCYGSSSSFYFISQMTAYLDTALQQRHSQIQLQTASGCFSSPVNAGKRGFAHSLLNLEQPVAEYCLTRLQEEYFVSLYWTSYHCVYPVIDSAEFAAHHRSLWETSATIRQPSALVDIVLAISMQYAATSTPSFPARPDLQHIYLGDPTIAGRWFYRRCQSFLTDELEGPSITTFQCYLLSVVWLCNASFQNMAHSVMAIGIRTGIILGLHLEPPEHLPPAIRQFRKRLWWTMYTLEMKFAMDLGRPLAVNISQVNCGLPDEPQNLDVTHLRQEPHLTSFSIQFIKLILATRGIYITFYHKCGEILGKTDQRNLSQDRASLEACAAFLKTKASYLHTWLQQVPEALKTPRTSMGEPFTTDRSTLDFQAFDHHPAGNHFPRQALFLELLYHSLSMNLYRPFITFHASRPTSTRPSVVESHALSCVNHAITITSIIDQVLEELGAQCQWNETFQWQWNALLSLIGYILAYPAGPATPTARRALSTSITVFERLSRSFASAVSAADVARDLAAKADLLVDRYRASLGLGSQAVSSSAPVPPVPCLSAPDHHPGMETPGLALDDGSGSNLLSAHTDDQTAVFPNSLMSSSAFTFTFDSFSGLRDGGTEGETVLDWLDFGDMEEI
ncbi:fungal-specific transcription factor domain-containing protein [Massariosphaeria phaeospora]|uniref:Fungal-specific transcription factor domain-containing protein n=1 Tax=Massariosphaeria phaeospora TaxID=100035 RepID=A0A7C8IDI1_9PLEO|nr:fungal-specific transcription factor domain-containing protein [Massariosphaeria phaeospora]